MSTDIAVTFYPPVGVPLREVLLGAAAGNGAAASQEGDVEGEASRDESDDSGLLEEGLSSLDEEDSEVSEEDDSESTGVVLKSIRLSSTQCYHASVSQAISHLLVLKCTLGSMGV